MMVVAMLWRTAVSAEGIADAGILIARPLPPARRVQNPYLET